MSSMSFKEQGGYIDKLLIPLIISIILLVGVAGFGIWAFAERQDYKTNSDQKAAAAAAAQKEATQAEDAARYAEEAKNPLKTFVGPSDFGSVTFQYPKTWSGYVMQFITAETPLESYFHPNVVPDVNLPTNAFALRVSIVEKPYSTVLEGYADATKKGTIFVAPYKFPKVERVIGTRIDGEISKDKRGSLILMPIRNVTLQVWTEAEQYLPDFDNIILPNLSFSP